MRLKKKRKNILPLDVTTLESTGSLFQGAGKAYKKLVKNAKKSNPSKFDRCVRDVKKKGGAASAYAVCTASGTRNKGTKSRKRNTTKLQRTLHRRAIDFRRNGRRNPEDAAAETYEFFHGRPPKEIIEVSIPIEEHTVLSGIGKLIALEIFAIDGRRIVKLEQFQGALLAQNEKRTQLYIEGGNQSVRPADFGISSPHEQEILGALLSVVYFTTKTHLRPEDGGMANYDHKFGNEGRDQKHVFGAKGSRIPLIGYDTRNKLLSILGGGYELPSEGIDG